MAGYFEFAVTVRNLSGNAYEIWIKNWGEWSWLEIQIWELFDMEIMVETIKVNELCKGVIIKGEEFYFKAPIFL